ncbi:MAG: type III PLP-dependent enzyme [Sedimentisphaerales bacterium]|nr:type III PLP-dependent enzyme [Sedimentisphaerales bacterium]
MKKKALTLAKLHGTPLFIIDHEKIRRNYRIFKKNLPRVQAYYAVKANPNQEIISTLFDEGASFDVASYNEFMQVYTHIRHFGEKDKDFYIWDKIIFSNTVKHRDTLKKIRRYKPLVTYDNADELEKIKEHCDTAGVVLRLKVPDVGSQVELSSKFGAEPADARTLIDQAFDLGLVVEGLSFHVGSQCTVFDNFTAALEIVSQVFHDARKRGHNLNIVDIGGGFPVPYDSQVPQFENLAKVINAELARHFPQDAEIIAEPGRFIVATAAVLVSQIVGKARRDGKIFYYINDGVYHTFSGVVYDHWTPNFRALSPRSHRAKAGATEVCAVVGPTCDSFDKISLSEQLPADLRIGDYLYTENIGAYSIASSTRFNGFEGAKVLSVNKRTRKKP